MDADAAGFANRVQTWYQRYGRHHLPWQQEDAYRVWLAEIMLQQTQVKTVIPYFNRFIERFPDTGSLAAAGNDDVLALWSGLGYYARARNLLKTAQLCVTQHAADLPDTPAALAALPGIGESTANAIFSQAYDQPAVVLDGNVKRVLSRHEAVDGWPGKASVHRHLWQKAEGLLPHHRGADYTQAIMDLGATLCTRSRPVCTHCPVQIDCKAHKQNRVTDFPASRPKIKITEKSFQMLIIKDAEGRVLLERRPPAGIWGGLWSLPADDNGETLNQRLSIKCNQLKTLPDLHHQLTHIRMTITPLIGEVKHLKNGVECNPAQDWFAQDKWVNLGLPKPVRQLLEQHMNLSHEDCE